MLFRLFILISFFAFNFSLYPSSTASKFIDDFQKNNTRMEAISSYKKIMKQPLTTSFPEDKYVNVRHEIQVQENTINDEQYILDILEVIDEYMVEKMIVVYPIVIIVLFFIILFIILNYLKNSSMSSDMDNLKEDLYSANQEIEALILKHKDMEVNHADTKESIDDLYDSSRTGREDIEKINNENIIQNKIITKSLDASIPVHAIDNHLKIDDNNKGDMFDNQELFEDDNFPTLNSEEPNIDKKQPNANINLEDVDLDLDLNVDKRKKKKEKSDFEEFDMGDFS